MVDVKCHFVSRWWKDSFIAYKFSCSLVTSGNPFRDNPLNHFAVNRGRINVGLSIRQNYFYRTDIKSYF